jgi:hypothetical protein
MCLLALLVIECCEEISTAIAIAIATAITAITIYMDGVRMYMLYRSYHVMLY